MILLNCTSGHVHSTDDHVKWCEEEVRAARRVAERQAQTMCPSCRIIGGAHSIICTV